MLQISQIAQHHKIRLIVPPSVLIGFGDKNRFMWTDVKTGFLKVRSAFITPATISEFLEEHMGSTKEQME